MYVKNTFLSEVWKSSGHTKKVRVIRLPDYQDSAAMVFTVVLIYLTILWIDSNQKKNSTKDFQKKKVLAIFEFY